MFRGLPMSFSSINTKTYDPNKLVEHYGVFELESVQMNATSGPFKAQIRENSADEFKIKVYRTLNNKKEEILNEKIKTRKKLLIQSKTAYNFTESIPESLVVNIKIEDKKKRNPLIFATKISIAKEDTLKPQVHQFQFTDNKTSTQFTLSLTFRIVLQSNQRITFYLKRNAFNKVATFDAERVMSSLYSPLITMLSVNSLILKARHKISVANHGDIYDLEVLNVDEPLFSALKIILNNQVVAISKTIGAEQLPKEKFENCINLNVENERAMLVQHAYGDYAIIKARYHYIQKGGRNLNELRLEWHSLLTKTSRFYKLKGRSFIEIINPEGTIKALIDLKTGFIHIELSKRVHHFEAFLAGLFSITYLYAFIFHNSSLC